MTLRTAAAVALLLLGFAGPALGEDYVRGKVAGPLVCATEKSATYAYYLPSGYTSARTWPLLFVFDPRSRGAFAAEMFRQAAEDYGWIVVSSNDTMSDTDAAPSVRAIAAMTEDVPKRFAVDGQRIYAAGFSGGAMYAWALAEAAPVAGIIGCSGRPMGPKVGKVRFGWFGTAGTLDFNYSETRAIADSLDRAASDWRAEYFDGAHRWAPVEVLRRGVEWMELLAMKRGTRSADGALVERLLSDDLVRAGAEQDVLWRQRHFEAIVRTFDGLADVAAARQRANELKSGRDYRRLLDEERAADAFEERCRNRMTATFVRLSDDSEERPTVPWLSHALDIAGLQRMARETSYRGVAAARVLETMYTNLHFYLARDFKAKGEGDRLAIVMAVAAQIHPEPPPPPRP